METKCYGYLRLIKKKEYQRYKISVEIVLISDRKRAIANATERCIALHNKKGY